MGEILKPKSRKYKGIFLEMQERYVRLLRLLRLAARNLIIHDGIEHAGYLSFLCILSIFPFITFTAAVTGFIGRVYADRYLKLELSSLLKNMLMDSDFSPFIHALLPRISEITNTPPKTLMTFALFSIVWTASSIFEGLRTILNRAYRIHNPPPYIMRRLLSILEFLVVVCAIVAMIIVIAVVPQILVFLGEQLLPIKADSNWEINLLAGEGAGLLWLQRAFQLLCSGAVVSSMYMYIPSSHRSFRSALPGTACVLVAFEIFRYLFSYYISTFPQINLIYGSIGGIVVALLFFYCGATIFIFGAEFNYLFSRRGFK